MTLGPLNKKVAEQSQIQLSVSRTYTAFTIIYMLCGIAAIVVGIFYSNAKNDSERIFIVTAYSLRAFIFLGVYFIACSLIGTLVALAPLRRKRLLQTHIIAIALIILTMLCISLWLWTRTLNINGVYGKYWRNDWSDSIKDAFQRDGNCCGFLSRADAPYMQSPSCKDANIDYGCMYTVIFYAQHHHRYIYAGLIVFMLMGLGSMTTGIILHMQCSNEERLRWAQTQYLARKAKRYQDSLGDDDDGSNTYSMHELQPTNSRSRYRNS
ncbi:hypothetical protein H4R99_008783 [Coemansia sp. RSA 1722]|nr:hypothetical protein H4R99_008783 [Coemansia sp. RSA 1722]